MEEALTWSFTAIAVAGSILNIRKNKACFPVWLVSNAGWIVYNYWKGIPAQSALFVIYTGLSIWGWITWNREEKADRKPGCVC